MILYVKLLQVANTHPTFPVHWDNEPDHKQEFKQTLAIHGLLTQVLGVILIDDHYQ